MASVLSFPKAARTVVGHCIQKARSIRAKELVLHFGQLTPLGFGRFEFSIYSNVPCHPVLEISPNLKDWNVLGQFEMESEVSLEDSSAIEALAGYYRVRCGETVSNIVGFINVEAVPGYCLIGYPFVHETGALGEVLHWAPTSAEIARFDPMVMKLRKSIYTGKWSDPAICLQNGDAILFFNPTSTVFPIVLSGSVPCTPVRRTLPAGATLCGSMLPVGGHIETDLRVPLHPGETFSIFDRGAQDLVEFKRTGSGWNKELPSLRVGEGFWIGKNVPSVWDQKLKA